MKILKENNAQKAIEQAVLASIGEGLVVIDREGKITMVNKVGERMLGWKHKELVGHTIADLPLEDEEGNLLIVNKRPYNKVFSNGKTIKKIYFIVRKDKTRFPIQVTVTPIKIGKKIVGAVDIFRDITREKEADRAKSEFISLASHQLRTPLGIAEWYLEAIKREGHLNKVSTVAKDYFNEVYKSNERLRILIRNLLSVSEVDYGKVRNRLEAINIVPLVKEVITKMNLFAVNNNVSSHLYIKKSNIPVIFVNRLRLKKVIENLIANAITYSKPTGKVEVTVDTQDNNLLIAVKDSGIGISKADKKKLFTKFFRSEKARIKNREGSGLGLYLVQAYVKGFNGTISVETVEEKGSIFTVSLPFTRKNKQRRSN